jgi:hypothetical protein
MKLLQRLALLCVGGALLAGPAVAASSRNVDLLQAFHKQLVAVKQHTKVPVLLPQKLPLDGNYKVYADGSGDRTGWLLELAGAPDCLGANACFVASFQGRRGQHLPGKPNLRLASGDRAFYHPVSCGGSCAPASLWFVHDGVLYSWQIKDLSNAKPALARLANEAIAAGAR